MTVEAYIESLPETNQELFLKVRNCIKNIDDAIEERISYGILGFFILNKPIVYIGGFKKHIGLYATPQGHEAFEEKLSKYKQGKGSVQFPLHQEIPYELINEIAEFRLKHIKNSNKK